ncbi:MAG TPA: phosphotransferase [Magnetospirillaceae bacterium]|nr:phosphotransferase [Magnetospirillaceae bacterium]
MIAPEAVVARILDAYSVDFLAIAAAQKGYRNSSFAVKTAHGTLNVILYKTEAGMAERIQRANFVGDFLAHRGLPARQTYSSRIIRLRGTALTKYAAIYHYLPGDTIPWEAYTMKHIKALGEAMGKMHAVLRNFSGTLPGATDELKALHARMRRYFSDIHVSRAMWQKLSLIISKHTFDKLPVSLHLKNQALHLDFVRGNILFQGAKITGILDFEKTARGPVEYDLARTLAFLFVDCKYKTEPKIRKYFLQSGYIKRGGGVIVDAGLLERLVSFFLLHDFYKFLRHNPYEALQRNEHFMRTRLVLLQRGLLSVK